MAQNLWRLTTRLSMPGGETPTGIERTVSFLPGYSFLTSLSYPLSNTPCEPLYVPDKLQQVEKERNNKDYHIQGWKKNKIFPDFITADVGKERADDYDNVYVLETKGIHLKMMIQNTSKMFLHFITR